MEINSVDAEDDQFAYRYDKSGKWITGIKSVKRKCVKCFLGVVSMITSWMKNEKDMPIEELGSIIKGILKDGLLAQLS